MKKLTILFYSAVLFPFWSLGQDFITTQSFNSRLLLNPAFTGYGEEGLTRIGMLHRAQYVSPGTYNLNSFTIDTRLCRPKKGARIGIGLIGSREEQGDGYLVSTFLGSSAGVHLKINKKLIFIMGLSFGIIQQSVNWSKFVFPDQINPWGVDMNAISANRNLTLNSGIIGVDLSGGVILTISDLFESGSGIKFHVGGSFYHLSKPNIGLVNDYLLPIRTNIHLGLSQEYKKSAYNITAKWIQQDYFQHQSYDIFLENVYNELFVCGIGARANVNNYISKNTLFIPLSIGFMKASDQHNWKFTTSYDINIGGVKNPFGIFEFTIVGNLKAPCSKEKSQKLKCVNF
jgi:type IX secretion system PorP/SprF family membrane protein